MNVFIEDDDSNDGHRGRIRSELPEHLILRHTGGTGERAEPEANARRRERDSRQRPDDGEAYDRVDGYESGSISEEVIHEHVALPQQAHDRAHRRGGQPHLTFESTAPEKPPLVYITKSKKHKPKVRQKNRRSHTAHQIDPVNQIDSVLDEEQNSDDALDEYYGGSGPMLSQNRRTLLINDRMHSRPSGSASYLGGQFHDRIDTYPGSHFDSKPEAQTYHYAAPASRIHAPPLRDEVNTSAPRPPDPDAQTEPPPRSRPRKGSKWTRVPRPTIGPNGTTVFTIQLKLSLMRQGERYRSREFTYRLGAWDDRDFALHLQQEYHNLKTKDIGIVQKITSYKMILFVYFLRYDNYRTQSRWGKWVVTHRTPVTPDDDQESKFAFMYAMKRKLKRRSEFFSTAWDNLPGAGRTTSNWTQRLDEMIFPGTVIDIDIEEKFDSKKIYFLLIVGIVASLGVALGYGFARDHDFSTGFSIASWLLTAFGFFAAVVAIGDFIGLDSPTSTLSAGKRYRINDEVRSDDGIRTVGGRAD